MSDDPKWLQWRREGITATDVADAAAGTYGGAYGVVARKQGRVTVEQNEQMSRGHRWQPVIADAVHVLTGLYVVGEETWCQCTGDERWRATVDGFLSPLAESSLDDCVAVLEVKTVGVGVSPNRQRWLSQMQWQLLVTGLDRALLAEARIDDTDDTCHGVRLEWVEADDLVQEDLIALAEEMWTHTQDGTLPEPEGASALPVVKEVYSTAEAGLDVVKLDATDVRFYADLKAEVKARQEQLDIMEAQIRDAMGQATKGAVDGYKISLSEPIKKLTAEREAELLETHPEFGTTVLDRARVKAEAKDLYESFQTRAGARVLRVTPPKENT